MGRIVIDKEGDHGEPVPGRLAAEVRAGADQLRLSQRELAELRRSLRTFRPVRRTGQTHRAAGLPARARGHPGPGAPGQTPGPATPPGPLPAREPANGLPGSDAGTGRKPGHEAPHRGCIQGRRAGGAAGTARRRHQVQLPAGLSGLRGTRRRELAAADRRSRCCPRRGPRRRISPGSCRRAGGSTRCAAPSRPAWMTSCRGSSRPEPTRWATCRSWAMARELDPDEHAVELDPGTPVDFDAFCWATPGLIDPVALAGVQDKLSAGMISMPVASAGRRYILKLNAPEFPHVVENEIRNVPLRGAGCGFPLSRVQLIRDVAGRPGLLVERFDRVPRGPNAAERARGGAAARRRGRGAGAGPVSGRQVQRGLRAGVPCARGVLRGAAAGAAEFGPAGGVCVAYRQRGPACQERFHGAAAGAGSGPSRRSTTSLPPWSTGTRRWP